MFGLNPWALLAIALAFGAALGWGAYERNALQDFRLEVKGREVIAANLLATKTAENAAVERKFGELKDQLEATHEAHRNEAEKQSAENDQLRGALASAVERVRRSAGGGAGGFGGVPSHPGSSAACGELQAALNQLSGAMGRLAEGGNGIARSADAEADAAGLGHDFAAGLRKVTITTP